VRIAFLMMDTYFLCLEDLYAYSIASL
jgi:hypothetical protein